MPTETPTIDVPDYSDHPIPDDLEWDTSYLRSEKLDSGVPELDEAYAQLADVGEKRAALRAKFGSRLLHGKELAALDEQYEEAVKHWASKELALFRKQEKGGEGYNERLLAFAAQLAIDEAAWTSEREAFHVQNSLKGKVLTWYNKGGMLQKVGVGVAIGAFTAGVTAATGGAAIIGGGLALAARASRGIVAGAAANHAARTAGQEERAEKHAMAAGEELVRAADELKPGRKVYKQDDLAELVKQTVGNARTAEHKEIRREGQKQLAKSAAYTAAGMLLGNVVATGLEERLSDVGITGDHDPQVGEPKIEGAKSVPFAEDVAEAPDLVAHVDTSAYESPWSWAESAYGQNHGSQAMLELSNKAAGAGHAVQWHNVVNGDYSRAWLSVDGRSDTDYVVNVLNKVR